MTGGHPIALTVEQEENDLRLDQFVCRRIPGISRGSVRRLLERGQVLVDGRPQPKGTRLVMGQQVLVAAVARTERPVPQPDLQLDVVLERPDLVAINKPAGIPCHPLVPGETDTVANAIAARYPECVDASSQAREGGLVHRLDWSTSGLLLAARSPESYGRLRGWFSGGHVLKHYLALVDGVVGKPGQIVSGIRTVPGDRTRMEVMWTAENQRGGREARTRFAPLEWTKGRTLVHVTCATGHRHQVRLHLAHVGYPIVGDDRYGASTVEGNEGAFLHAARVELLEEDAQLEAPLPGHRQEVLLRLGISILEPPRSRITVPRQQIVKQQD